MDIFDEELLSFWNILNQNGVRYIMVGGIATNFNGFQRLTVDVDVWLDDSAENRTRFRKAFYEYSGEDFSLLETVQFVPGWTTFHLNNGYELDLMTALKGLENYSFNECHQMANIAHIDNIDIPFLHINHLIFNKKSVNRPKDQVDVEALEKIKEMRSGDPNTENATNL